MKGFSDERLARVKLDDIRAAGGYALSERRDYGKDVVNYQLRIGWDRKTDRFSFDSVFASLRKEVSIPDITIDGISLKELDSAMATVPWSHGDFYSPGAAIPRLNEPSTKEFQQFVFEIFGKLGQLAAADGQGGDVFSERLMLKHVAHTPTERAFNLQRVREKYEISYEFNMHGNLAVDIDQIYNLLDGRSVSRTMMSEKLEVDHGYLRFREAGEDFALEWRPSRKKFPITERILEDAIKGSLEQFNIGDLLYDLHNGKELVLPYGGGAAGELVMVSWDAPGDDSLHMREATKGVGISLSLAAAHEFSRQVERLGWKGYGKFIHRNALNGRDSFSLYKTWERDDRRYGFEMAVRYDGKVKAFYARTVRGALIEPINLPISKIAGIDIPYLERRAREVSWKSRDFWEMGLSPSRGAASAMYQTAEGVLDDFQALFINDDINARWTGSAFYMKYLRFTPNEYIIDDNEVFRKRFEVAAILDPKEYPTVSLRQFANMLDGRLVQIERGEQKEWIQIRRVEDDYLVQRSPAKYFDKWNRLFKNPPIANATAMGVDRNFESILRASLINGDPVSLQVDIYGTKFYVGIFLDPEMWLAIAEPRWDTSPEALLLMDRYRWSVSAVPPRLPVGQVRDFGLHPSEINRIDLDSIITQLGNAGFRLELDKFLDMGIHTGYGEFAISLVAQRGSMSMDVDLHIKQMGNGDYTFDHFVLSREGAAYDRPVKARFPGQKATGKGEFFVYREAVNMFLGGFVQHPTYYGSDKKEWYYMDASSQDEDGYLKLAKMEDKLNLTDVLMDYPFVQLEQPDEKAALLKSLGEGDIVMVNVRELSQSRQQFISAHPLRGGIRFHFLETTSRAMSIKPKDNKEVFIVAGREYSQDNTRARKQGR